MRIIDDSSLNEAAEQRMSLTGRRGEFRVELTAHEPGVIWNLNHFYQHTIRRFANELQASIRQHLEIIVVELVAMAVSLNYFVLPITSVSR